MTRPLSVRIMSVPLSPPLNEVDPSGRHGSHVLMCTLGHTTPDS